jgi:DNA-binding MarR family transcriptional regulator
VATEQSILARLRGLVLAIDALIDSSAAEVGVSTRDRQALGVIADRPGITAGDLATSLRISSGAVTGVLDRLECAGLVERVADPADRRRVLARATEGGEMVERRMWTALERRLVSLTAAYTSTELEVVLGFLADAREAVGG